MAEALDDVPRRKEELGTLLFNAKLYVSH